MLILSFNHLNKRAHRQCSDLIFVTKYTVMASETVMALDHTKGTEFLQQL